MIWLCGSAVEASYLAAGRGLQRGEYRIANRVEQAVGQHVAADDTIKLLVDADEGAVEAYTELVFRQALAA